MKDAFTSISFEETNNPIKVLSLLKKPVDLLTFPTLVLQKLDPNIFSH
jgi:hypothetical protein